MCQLKYKIWIEVEEGKIFGVGPLKLLRGVKETGSLSEAAKNMNMSYNKAHTLIKSIEEKLGYKLISSRTGGLKGGGSELTEKAEKFIIAYQNFYDECETSLKEIFSRHFNDICL